MMWKGLFMARPKREIIPVKTHTLVVRLDDIQYSIIEKYARQLGIPMAEYVRRQATQGKVEISYPIVADIEQLQKLTDEFHAIGNNLNQIARYFNMGGLHSMAIRQEINECVMELMNMRKAVMSMAGDFNGSISILRIIKMNYQSHAPMLTASWEKGEAGISQKIRS